MCNGGVKVEQWKKISGRWFALAIYALLLFITVQIPFLGMVTFFFLPIPFILVMIKEKFLGYLDF